MDPDPSQSTSGAIRINVSYMPSKSKRILTRYCSFGTYDHLILLLGRVASFAASDLTRKRKAFKAPPGPPSGNTPPPFPGIIPVQGNFQTPLGFSPPRQVSPQSEKSDDSDPRAKLEAAIEEWESIKKAFEDLKNSFGPDFRPLSPEYADRRESPFGLAVQYRTYSISGVWMNYYMGLIHLHRAHPNMPPAAMQAAGMAAKDTSVYANQIGRIASGLWADSPRSTPDPLTVAALIECSFCLFVAGVQVGRQSDQELFAFTNIDLTVPIG